MNHLELHNRTNQVSDKLHLGTHWMTDRRKTKTNTFALHLRDVNGMNIYIFKNKKEPALE